MRSPTPGRLLSKYQPSFTMPIEETGQVEGVQRQEDDMVVFEWLEDGGFRLLECDVRDTSTDEGAEVHEEGAYPQVGVVEGADMEQEAQGKSAAALLIQAAVQGCLSRATMSRTQVASHRIRALASARHAKVTVAKKAQEEAKRMALADIAAVKAVAAENARKEAAAAHERLRVLKVRRIAVLKIQAAVRAHRDRELVAAKAKEVEVSTVFRIAKIARSELVYVNRLLAGPGFTHPQAFDSLSEYIGCLETGIRCFLPGYRCCYGSCFTDDVLADDIYETADSWSVSKTCILQAAATIDFQRMVDWIHRWHTEYPDPNSPAAVILTLLSDYRSK